MSKQFFIHCDGGFGNRFNALICGLAIAKKVGFTPTILWPSTNWCRSKFNTLFNSDLSVIESNLTYFQENPHEYEFIMHGNFLNFPTAVYHPNGFSSIDHVASFCLETLKDNIVYNNDSIPYYFDQNTIIDTIKTLSFTEQIIQRAEDFISSNNLSEGFCGVHLRNTDFYDPHKPDFDGLYNMIQSNLDKNYFVCSDDKELEDKFNQLDNVFVFPKTKYVEKLTEEGDWRSVIVDEVGVEYPFNVERSDESVIQAMIDLTILSKSDIIKTSDSSFLKTAILLKDAFNG